MNLYEKNGVFSTIGNGQFGKIERTGWKKSRFGKDKKEAIIEKLQDGNITRVFRKGDDIYYKNKFGEYQIEFD